MMVSDHSLWGVHTWWGSEDGNDDLWNSWCMGLKQLEPPYLYGYAIRFNHWPQSWFFGLCREKRGQQLVLRELDQFKTKEIRGWGSSAAEESPNLETSA